MVVRSNGMRYATSGKHPWWTTTWERAERRSQNRVAEFMKNSSHQSVTDSNAKEFKDSNEIFNKIVRRVRKQHPELSNIKARLYARNKDPIGRKYQRLERQGYDAGEISKRLFGRGGKASSGRGGKASSGRGGN